MNNDYKFQDPWVTNIIYLTDFFLTKRIIEFLLSFTIFIERKIKLFNSCHLLLNDTSSIKPEFLAIILLNMP